MSFNLLILVYAAVFAAVLLLVEGLYYLTTDRRESDVRKKINRRMQWLAEGVERSVVAARLRRRSIDEAPGFKGQVLRLSFVQRLEKTMAQAGLTVTTWRFLTTCGIASLTLLIVLNVLVHVPIGIAVFAAGGGGLGLPILVVSQKARKRIRKLQEQLPEALDMIVRSLRAGHPVATAINLVANEMPDPLGSEFGLVSDEIAFGLDLQSALENMSLRVAFGDLRFMVVAVKMQAITGGNLAEVLGGLARLIRERQRMHLKVLALSSEGRFSVKILCGLPIVFFGLISLISPKYYAAVYTDPTLTHLMEVGIVMLLIGMYLMRRIVNFRV